MTEIKKYSPNDAIFLSQDESKRAAAHLNQVAGPAFTLFSDKKPIACGGVRIYGVGELWMISNDKNRKNHIKSIYSTSKKEIEKMIRENHLWRVMAERNESDAWLKHLGFSESKKKLFTRA